MIDRGATAAVSFDTVTKSYGDVHALHDVTFDIEPSELVAVLGPNGAGKTTMFEMALGLGRPSEGNVRVLGGAPGGKDVATRVGAMLQNAGLQEAVSVRDVIGLIAQSYPSAHPVDDVLDRVGMSSRSERMVSDLSGGERQRLLLGIAIIGMPDLLVLDEPTAAMDVEARRAFWDEAGKAVNDGTTVLFATHNLAEADEVADRVIVLREGHIVADSTPAELKRRVHGKVAEFVTDIPPERVRSLITLGTVEEIPVNGGWWRVRVHSDAPAGVIATLVIEEDGRIDDLTVRDADLEDAFVELIADSPTHTRGTR